VLYLNVIVSVRLAERFELRSYLYLENPEGATSKTNRIYIGEDKNGEQWRGNDILSAVARVANP